MTDAHKQLSIADLELPAKRGRPKSGNALSNSEKQKLYRERAKQAGKKHLLVEPFEAALIESMLSHHIVELPESNPLRDAYIVIRRKVQQLM